MQALPKALARRGHRVMVVMPRYKDYEGVFDTEVGGGGAQRCNAVPKREFKRVINSTFGSV